MTVSHGFELFRDEEVSEINARARMWRHVKTGAELLSIEIDDENKVFGITFRTPPSDSTGVPHILEHAVLGGSRKYRVREPFVELVKGSLNTFVNAFTYPDKTVYPVASTNQQDFYNLIEVYLDAVLHPLITPHHLQQEGWHYELDDVDGPLTFKGVVFNEMKGAYSSPDDVLRRQSQRSLFPDTVYGQDSGGDPAAIPDLTYEQFKGFHDRYYHPSNARIFFYGDDDPEERLRILDEYLTEFEELPVDSEIPLQPTFEKPQRLELPYSVDADQTNGQAPKAMVQVNWALPPYTDATEVMALDVLSYALLGTPASPLRKALIDSGLGEDLTGAGYRTGMLQPMFSVGLKGVAEADTEQVEVLILETLRLLAKEGFDPDMVEAAVNTTEFELRENNTGRYPRGLSVMLTALGTWLYDGDPLLPLRYDAPLTAVESNLDADPTYLQNLIRAHLLDNPHRTTVFLLPDPALTERRDAAEKARLAAARSEMDADAIQAVLENMQTLRRIQETPDSPEDLAALPMLTRDDLDREEKEIPLDVAESHGSQVLFHDLFTNGILYVDLGFNLRALPQDLLPFARLFGRALLEMGTETEDYVKLSQRIGRKTGGIGTTAFTSAVETDEGGAAWLIVRGKSTIEQTADLLDLLRDVLLTVQLDNRERFRQMVLEAKASAEAGLVPGGHIVVNTRLRAHYSAGDWAGEQIGGVENIFFLRRLAEQIENDWSAVLARLEEIRRRLINRSAMVCNVTLDAESYGRFHPRLTQFIESLPTAEPELYTWTPAAFAPNEGLTIPAQVNYVGKGARLYDLGYELHGSIMVVTNLLRTTWLWEKIRVQGGAYGGFSTFGKQSGVFNFLSYRDPNLMGSLATYDGTADFLRHLELSDDELTKNIIGAIGTLDAYQLPDAKGYTSMLRHLLGETHAERQQFRDEVLGTTLADLRAFGDVLGEVARVGRVVVLGAPGAISAASGDDAWLQIQKVL